MSDIIAKALADKAHDLVGQLIDIPFPDWETTTDTQKRFWRELASAAASAVAKQPDRKPK